LSDFKGTLNLFCIYLPLFQYIFISIYSYFTDSFVFHCIFAIVHRTSDVFSCKRVFSSFSVDVDKSRHEGPSAEVD